MVGATARVVLVEYYLTEASALVFGVTAEQAAPEMVSVALPRHTVRELADQVQATLLTDHLALSSLLGDERLVGLVAPVTRWARPGDVVYLVPHDALHRLPLHAVAVDGGCSLIARNPVVVAPSTSVLQYCLVKRTGRSRDTALVVADPPAERPLVFAREQAHAVVEQFGDAQLLAGPSASRAKVLERLAGSGTKPGVIHFTAHGVFDPRDPMNSGIELAGGRLTAADILGLSMDADLVTLGACETGVSDRRPGDELLGLTRALLYAGARTALVTLWRVDELSTSMLLQRFYTELASGVSKAEALRRAQLWLSVQTVTDVLDYAGRARARLAEEPGAAVVLAREEARLMALAGDRNGAERRLTELLQAEELTEPERAGLRVALLRIRSAGPLPDAGPDLAVFAEPYYWAPFVLVGDWY